jgi:hypothetical protein
VRFTLLNGLGACQELIGRPGPRGNTCHKGKTLSWPFPSAPYAFLSCYMLPVLKTLLDFLRRFRFPKSYPKRRSGDWVWLFAFIFRRLGLWRLWPRKSDTFPKSRPASPSFPRVEARGYSVLGSSADVVAASTVPTSASLPSLQERVPRQLTTATPATPAPTTANLTADRPPFAYDSKRPGSRSSAEVSTHSRASDRLSILTQSRESLRAPVGQPSRLPRATYRQFGLGPKSIPSREQLSRSPSPSIRFHPPHQPPRLHVDTSDVHPHVVVVNPTTSPATPQEASSYTHEPLSPPADHRSHRRQSPGSGSVAVDIQTLSTESLPLSPSSPPPPLTLAIDPATVRSSSTISVGAQVLEEESPQLSPIASSLISEFSIPEGRYIALIHSDQVPRYSKGIKMQVNDSVLLFHPYVC